MLCYTQFVEAEQRLSYVLAGYGLTMQFYLYITGSQLLFSPDTIIQFSSPCDLLRLILTHIF